MYSLNFDVNINVNSSTLNNVTGIGECLVIRNERVYRNVNKDEYDTVVAVKT